MKHSLLVRWSAVGLLAAAMVGCGGSGGGDGSGGTGNPPPAPGTPAASISAAAAVSSNDTATNTSASFTALQDAGIPAVTINSAPIVNFAVFSDGKAKTDVVIADVRFAIAKLVPGTNSNPDQWVNYVYSKVPGKAGFGPGTPPTPVLATAMQATSDGKMSAAELTAAGLTGQLSFNPDGYYSYTFKTNITDPTKTNNVVFEPGLTHRVAIQLSYKNAAGETILVNPYFDFTVVNGKSVAVTDPAKTRKMTDVASCNGCHEKLALHGGGRVDTQYCVMCHNPGTVDPESGNNLNLSTMVHKIHSGKSLKSKLATAGGEDYTIWGYTNTKYNYAEVGFPQDLRNCTKCHTAANPKTPQGDNWKTKPSKEACLTCHASNANSAWDISHKVFAGTFVGAGAAAKDLTNAQCANCHVGQISSERVHWNQNEENSAKYKMNIESTTYDATARKVTVKYFLSDPTNGNAAYNLVTPDCTFTGTTGICAPAGTRPTITAKFGNLRFYLAYQNMVGQSAAVTEYSSYNNGGSNASAYAHMGANDGSNHYTVDIPLPADVSGISVAAGTARVVSIGQIKELKLKVKTNVEPRPVDDSVAPIPLINVVVQHTFKELALSGTLNPRRVVVSNEKCNVCHGSLGTTSGANTLAEAFHGGARNTVEACVVCHDANRPSSTVMTNGLAYNESYQFKRLIHGIHGNTKRTFPFTYGNKAVGAFNKDGTSVIAGGTPLASTVENYAAEVAWPGVGINCNACHVNNSYKQDLGPLGAVVLKGPVTLVGSGMTVTADLNPNYWLVISPKAASCTACHDSSKAMAHVTSFGGSAVGDKTQAQIAAMPKETCEDCHASGGFKGVDTVHDQK
jgi:OmcA/MtrC family decaheme c-type cytochrome